ncbi:MAG: metallothionein [Pseudobacteriovorax sp.]|nr:metallothionein [Pseudobacteriovorax sp.]
MKCACSDCLCIVDTSTAKETNGKFYCSDECANHTGKGCGHKGCDCKGA